MCSFLVGFVATDVFPFRFRGVRISVTPVFVCVCVCVCMHLVPFVPVQFRLLGFRAMFSPPYGLRAWC